MVEKFKKVEYIMEFAKNEFGAVPGKEVRMRGDLDRYAAKNA
jgi:hypothetical protein